MFALRSEYPGGLELITFCENVSCIVQQEVVERTDYLLSFDKTWTAEKMTQPTFLVLLRVYSLPW
jgi:hypothetical protein